jgi:hypothetical protein
MSTAKNPSAVDVTTIRFSPFIWVFRTVWQDAHNQARNKWTSPKLEIKMIFSLGLSCWYVRAGNLGVESGTIGLVAHNL